MTNRGKRTTKTCEECGREFAGLFKQRFCSHSCASKVTARRRSLPPRPKTGEDVGCEICGRIFYAKRHFLVKGQGRFCSATCRKQWEKRLSVWLPCEWCAKKFRVSPFRARRARFCSRACWSEGGRTKFLSRTHNGRRVRQVPAGYIQVWQPDHPESTPYGGWVWEHRLVAEKKIGRPLEKIETVHHANGIKYDNAPGNLLVIKRGEHTRITNRRRDAKAKKDKAELAEYRRRFGSLKGR